MWRSLSILICHTGSGIVLIDEEGPGWARMGRRGRTGLSSPILGHHPPELNFNREELRILVSVYRFNWRH